ncbi:MAG: AmmeMemoRadiSam system protein B, partial [Chloroflexi bacterium]|nr:AmmeMemoRadiSam system protein B [Chloroflexota bacterium]
LRPVNMQWVQWQGQEVLSLQDPLRLGDGSLMVPRPIAPLLGLMDGTRDLNGLRTGFLLRTGVQLLPSQVESIVEKLDENLLLDSHRFRDAMEHALLDYRSSPFREPALAGAGYPDDGAALRSTLDDYCQKAGVNGADPSGGVLGLISPHIDYHRGWQTYAEAWHPARRAVREADLVIILGTDHSGSSGSLTLTRQDYATPWGSMPTDVPIVDRLAEILGEDNAFAEEVHHVGEHSIELASVWLHYYAGGQPKRLLPILCGHHEALLGSDGPEATRVWEALSYLSDVAKQQNTLVVAAGDLSHMGPAFGDPLPLDPAGKASIRSTDETWLEVACSGDSSRLTSHLLEHGDPTRICGSAPIHYMIAILQNAQGQVVAYDQCPADEEFGSLVSIAGVLYSA